MSPILRERMLVGTAKVLATFEYKRGSRTSRLAGVELVSGALEKAPHALFRILRGGEVVHEGRCTSLKQGKQAVGSVEGAAQQCGLVLDGGAFDAYQPGDVIECYAERERQAEVRMPV